MPLLDLRIDDTLVDDFSPLKDTRISKLLCDFKPERDTAILRSIKTLKTINKLPAAEFWKQVDAGKIPGADKTADASAPPAAVDDAFIKEVAALPAEEQVKRVMAKLKEINPGYAGKETHTCFGGEVIRLLLDSDNNLGNIEPVRALHLLDTFSCGGESGASRSQLRDLSPLRGLRLDFLACANSQIADLSPLEGMPLTVLNCAGTRVRDLSPLKGMKLLKLGLNGSGVSDLTPLAGMPLTNLVIKQTGVTNLALLKEMPLFKLSCDFKPNRDTAILRSIKTLENINDLPAAEF